MYSRGTSGGRPTGTTASEGDIVGTSGGRPTGTSASEGYAVSGGRPIGARKLISFLGDLKSGIPPC